MPAAAVIPAPRAYINVVAVKKPVVGFEARLGWCPACMKGSPGLSVSRARYGGYPDTCGIVHWLRLP